MSFFEKEKTTIILLAVFLCHFKGNIDLYYIN